MRLILSIQDSNTQRKFQVQVTQTIPVLQLKQIVSNQVSLPPSSILITLFFNNTQTLLSDDQTLLSYNINQDSRLIIDLIRPQREAEMAMKEQFRSRRAMTAQTALAPIQNWLGSLFDKIRAGSLSGVLQVIAEYAKKYPSEEDEYDLISQSDQNGWTSLHVACLAGHSNIVQTLVTQQAIPNKESNDNWTPLQLAAYNGNQTCVRALLKHPRLQIDRMTQTRGPALHIACSKGSGAIVQMLLDSGASMIITDQNDQIPLELATTQEIVEILPKYMGERQLKEIESPSESPDMISSQGLVVNTGSLVLHDNQVLLRLDCGGGILECCKIEDPSQKIVTGKLIDIYDLKMTAGLKYGSKDTQNIIIFGKSGIFKFYTMSRYETLDWFRRIEKAINYAHQNKIGVAVSQPEEGKKVGRQDMFLQTQSPGPAKQRVNFKSFTILQEIGSGSFGKVFKIIKNNTKKVYALKLLNKQFLIKQKQLKYAIGECKILSYMSHPFIIQLNYAFQTPKNLYMVIQYCPNGDLMTHLVDRTRFPESVAKFYIAQTILAIEYLHSLDIVYRDLKPQNILIDRAGHIRLADFGLAKENVNPLNPAMSFCGSPAYLAPQMLGKTGSQKSADVYGIGAILYELITGMPPFYSDNIRELFRNIKNGMLQFPRIVKPQAQDLLRKLMDKDPRKRPLIGQIKSHIFFSGIDWELLEQMKIRPPRLGSKWVQVDQFREDEYSEIPLSNKKILVDEDYEEDDELDEELAEFNYAR